MPKIKKAVRLQSNKKKLEQIHPLKQEDFKNINERLEMIDKEIEKEKEMSQIRIKSLKLEKVFLNNYLKDRMKIYKKMRK